VKVRKKEVVAQSTMEANIERNRKKIKELNRGFLVQGGILKSIEELDTSEITWKKDKFDEERTSQGSQSVVVYRQG